MRTSESQSEAIRAFGNCQRLKAAERRKLAAAFGKMGRAHAWRIVKDYAHGLVNDVGESFLELVHAWLVLGERSFEITFRIIRAVKLAIDDGLDHIGGLIKEVKRFFPRLSQKWLVRKINFVRALLGETFAFAA